MFARIILSCSEKVSECLIRSHNPRPYRLQLADLSFGVRRSAAICSIADLLLLLYPCMRS
jgi:hypothetical protein